MYMYVYGDSVHVTVCVRVCMHAFLCYQTKLHTNTDYIRHCLQIAIIIGSSGILTSSNTVWYFIVSLYTIIHAVHVMPVRCGGCVGGSFGGCFCSLVWLVFERSLRKRHFLLWYCHALTGLIVNEELIAGLTFVFYYQNNCYWPTVQQSFCWLQFSQFQVFSLLFLAI